MQDTKNKYANYAVSCEQNVEFEEDKITLDVTEKVQTGGWTITPCSYPRVRVSL